MAQGLDALTREELVELLEITAKDLIALDGTWFQSLEREQGMDTAMEHDRAAWRRFVPSKSVGELEYAGFAAALDDRIHCECVSCFPDVTDNTCNCAWRFWVEG